MGIWLAARSKDHDVTTTSQQTLGIKYGLSNNHPRRCDETEDASGILPPPPLPHWLIIYWMWNDYLNTKDQTARQSGDYRQTPWQTNASLRITGVSDSGIIRRRQISIFRTISMAEWQPAVAYVRIQSDELIFFLYLNDSILSLLIMAAYFYSVILCLAINPPKY